MSEDTCVLCIVEKREKAKLLKKWKRFLELEDKHPGYHQQYDVLDFLSEYHEDEL